MYVWIGCDVSNKLKEFRERVVEFNRELGLSAQALALAPHVSLKIVFEIEDAVARHCINDMIDYCQGLKPFTVKVEELEKKGGIIWLRMAESKELCEIHNKLDEIAVSYAIKRHPLDKEFIFHSTAIMDEEQLDKIDVMYEKLKNVPYPDELKINTILIAHSFDNITFKVDRRIKIK